MKKTAINIFIFVFAALFVAVNAKAALALPRLTLTPLTGTYTNGSTFTVSIGVNSETEKSSAVDVWATFDATKLEVVSIVKSTNPPFAFEMTPSIDNAAGTFNFACSSTNTSSFEDVAINGELAIITFKAKAIGTAAVNFTCTAGSTVDSNIFVFNTSYNDVISCPANSSGLYTITAAASGGSTTTVTPTLTTTRTTATALPQTGGIATTLGLIVFGAVSVASALFLKFL